jgi:hypothetical protein
MKTKRKATFCVLLLCKQNSDAFVKWKQCTRQRQEAAQRKRNGVENNKMTSQPTKQVLRDATLASQRTQPKTKPSDLN